MLTFRKYCFQNRWTTFKRMYADKPFSLIKLVFVSLFSIWLGGKICPRVQKVSCGQGHPGSAWPGEDLWAHWRGTYYTLQTLWKNWEPIWMLIHIWFAWHNHLLTGWGSNLRPLPFTIHSDTDLLYKQLMVTESFTTTHESDSKVNGLKWHQPTDLHPLLCIVKDLERVSSNDMLLFLVWRNSIKKQRKINIGFVCTEYLPWINVTGPALPSATFALSLRLPLTSWRVVSLWQWLSSRFAFNAQLSAEYWTANVIVCCLQSKSLNKSLATEQLSWQHPRPNKTRPLSQ